MANVPLLAEILSSVGSGPAVVPGVPAVVPPVVVPPVVPPSVVDVPAVALPPVLAPPASSVPPVSDVALPPVLVPPMAGVPPVPDVLLPPAPVVPTVPSVLLPPVTDVPPVVLLEVLNAPPVAPSSEVPPDEDSALIAPVLAVTPDCPGAPPAFDASTAPSPVEQAMTAHAKSGANRTGLIAGFFTFCPLQECEPSQAVTSFTVPSSN